MTEDEQRKYNEKIELDASIKNMFEKYKKLTKGSIDYSKLKLAEGFNTYKAPLRQLNEDNRLVMSEEISHHNITLKIKVLTSLLLIQKIKL